MCSLASQDDFEAFCVLLVDHEIQEDDQVSIVEEERTLFPDVFEDSFVSIEDRQEQGQQHAFLLGKIDFFFASLAWRVKRVLVRPLANRFPSAFFFNFERGQKRIPQLHIRIVNQILHKLGPLVKDGEGEGVPVESGVVCKEHHGSFVYFEVPVKQIIQSSLVVGVLVAY
jgi:hypothetical protein